ncbi:STT3 domain-containing protein [Halosimplex halobium]|uniref:STT3 domain-containing protein n=1 Tax=Halosimplex halobium TaxID=3396618 RepID=UPI003F573843
MADRDDLAARAAEDPEFEAALAALLDADKATDSWTFDDVPVDTGTFGRLVEQGVVEDADGGYRLADPETVRAALEADVAAADETESSDGGGAAAVVASLSLPDLPSARDIDERDISTVASARGTAVGVVLSVAALFVWTRAYIYRDVFRGGDVVLTANDPYFYRYQVDRLLSGAGGPLDPGALVDLPTGEPLFLAVIWLVAGLAGGGQVATGAVLAWYPVVAAVATAAILYLLGARVMDDRRVGLVAALVLALVPTFAFRTSLGFADHHAFDYVWATVTLTVLARVVTVDADEAFESTGLGGAGLLGVAVAGQTLAWEGSPLLLVPVAGYLAAAVPLDVVEERSPLRANGPVLAGIGVAAALTLGAHAALGWQSVAVAVVPGVLLAGGLALVGVGEFVHRGSLSVRALVGAELAGPVVGLVTLWVVLPETVGRLLGGVGFLLLRSNVAEKDPVFTPGNTFGLEFFGVVVLLGLPVMVWALRRAALGDRQWLALSGYAWWLLFLSALQIRFAAHFAPILAVFAAVAFVWLLARRDLAALPAPVRRPVGTEWRTATGADGGAPDGFDRAALTPRSVAVPALVVLAVVGGGVVYLPADVENGVVEEETYRAASWMGGYADEQGLDYPDSYVFSRWSVNRVYNYFTSGVAENYSRAQGNYTSFIYDDSAASARWYERLYEDTGFVVVEPLPRRDGTIQKHLYVTYGSRWAEQGYDAVSHYRAVYASTSTTTKVFTLVPGATVTGTAPVNATVEARMTVEIPNTSFLYRQQATVRSDGTYRLVVPYPGTYDLTAGNESRSVRVPDSAVVDGSRVSVEN